MNFKLKDIVILVVVLMMFVFMFSQMHQLKKQMIELQKPPVVETIVEIRVVNVPEHSKILYREEITEVIETYMVLGKLDAIAEFYNDYVEDWELTYLIMGAAQVYKIPANVLFALIYAESNFTELAVNNGNGNGTSDYGLLQLNSSTFKGYTKEQLMDRNYNLRLGCKHLRQRYEQYGSWDEAVMYYNGFSQMAVKHQAKVLAKERELDKAFNMSGLAWEIEAHRILEGS